MITPSAALRCVHLYSPQPAALAAFYARAYGMQAAAAGEVWHCRAPGRHVGISPGPANRLRYALFACDSPAAMSALRGRLAHLPPATLPQGCGLPDDAACVTDPDDNVVVFMQACDADVHAARTGMDKSAELQHFALRTAQLPAMLHFYADALGFVLSDRVRDGEGRVRAAFLRTNALHHALALFDAPVTCFDHQSFETADWTALRHWADHMGRLRETIVWGVGRHGPGNDVFFMVRDPDGNLAEISAEIEVCAQDRPPGEWAHEERTLNLWGRAILRS